MKKYLLLILAALTQASYGTDNPLSNMQEERPIPFLMRGTIQKSGRPEPYAGMTDYAILTPGGKYILSYYHLRSYEWQNMYDEFKKLQDGDEVCANGWGSWDGRDVGYGEKADIEFLPEELGKDRYQIIYVNSFEPCVALPAWRDPSQKYNSRASVSGNKYTVQNVRWGKNADGSHNWKTAQIDPSLLNKVYWVKKPLPGWGSGDHALILFTFQKGGMMSDNEQSSGLVLSVEARWRDDTFPNHDTLLNRTFNITWMLSTEEDYIVKTCASPDKDNTLYPAEIKLSPAQKTELLHRALILASKDREGEFYNAQSNNCQSGLYRLINGVLPKDSRISFLKYGEINLKQDEKLNVLLDKPLPPITPQNYKNSAVWPK